MTSFQQIMTSVEVVGFPKERLKYQQKKEIVGNFNGLKIQNCSRNANQY